MNERWVAPLVQILQPCTHIMFMLLSKKPKGPLWNGLQLNSQNEYLGLIPVRFGASASKLSIFCCGHFLPGSTERVIQVNRGTLIWSCSLNNTWTWKFEMTVCRAKLNCETNCMCHTCNVLLKGSFWHVFIDKGHVLSILAVTNHRHEILVMNPCQNLSLNK